MRIVSWNSNGRVVNLRKMLNAIGAQVCVIQEPTGTLDLSGGARRSADQSPITWTGTHVVGSCAQDNYFFGYSQTITCSYHLTQTDPRDASAITDGYARNYLIVKVKGGGESVRLATFHAPYGLSTENRQDLNISAVEYLQSLLGSGLRFTRPAKGGAAGPPAQKQLDLILADTNIYDNSDCGHLTWPCVLNSPTGKGRGGGSLDRIFLRPGTFPNYRCGRIFPGANAQPVSSVDRRSGKVKDIVLPDEPEYQDWLKSDHLAIYFDTDSTRDALPVLAVGSGAKPKRDDSDLVELDDRGQPRVVKKREVGV